MTTKERAAKKRKLPGGVRLIKSGRYEKRFVVGGVRYSVYGKTLRELSQKETERRIEIQAGTYKKNSSITLNEYFQEWEAQKGKTVSPATMYNYEKLYRLHIKKPLGRYNVKNIERRQLITFFNSIAEKVSVYMANSCRSLLLQVFQTACYDEIIPVNIVKNIPRIKGKNATHARDTIHRALTKAELSAFMGQIVDSLYFNAFRFMLATGVRAGECAGLEWKDIDRKNGVIHVRRTMTTDINGKRVIGQTTKTRRSRRDIPINSEIAEILAAQFNQNKALFGDIISIDGFVFPNSKNEALNPAMFNETITRAIAAYNKKNTKKPKSERGITLEHFSIHAFRDTFASRAAAAGVPLNVLKELLGHSSYAMTADLYGHIYEEQKKTAMENLKMVVD